MMRQYEEAKRACPDALLLFRMGDFYELFRDDAKIAAATLGLALTSREKGENAVPMAGFPHHQLDAYLRKLVAAGMRAAVCEQVEDPKKAKGLVRREVTRVVTPGTITDDALLDPRKSNYLAAVVPGSVAGVAWVELSTGRFMAAGCAGDRLADHLAHIAPAEILLSQDAEDLPEAIFGEPVVARRPDWAFSAVAAREALAKHFGTATLEGFGFDADGADTQAIRAAGAVLDYLTETQRSSLGHIDRLLPYRDDRTLQIDEATRRSLEITRTMRDGRREGSLLAVLDQCVTAAGSRTMAEWIAGPLIDGHAIGRRLDAVEELLAEPALCGDLREALGRSYDIERLIARISTRRASPRDLSFLGRTLACLPAVKAKLTARRSELLGHLESQIDLCPPLRAQLEAALVDDCPLSSQDGGIIRSGHHEQLDSLRELARGGKQWIAQYQAAQTERIGVPTLKVGFNRVFGYYLEVTNAHRDKIPEDYIRKQTLKNAERYITPELKEYEEKVLTADERAKELEYELFLELRETAAASTRALQGTAAALAGVDVLAGLAELARQRNYVRPSLTEDPILRIVDGRHPVLDMLAPEGTFVPNDTHISIDSTSGDSATGDSAASSSTGSILLITGPNMAGKSTYIRQVALLTLMAQVGSFVPASQATIGIADRIFARVGASDELSRGQSTFMVEMTETARILNTATRRSLIILDEIGRGTSTYDGISLAWAVVEHLHDRIGARTLFATHYHELTDLEQSLSGVENLNVAVREWQDDVVFLHKIIEGAADKSYGIHVARLAGVPREVIERSKDILSQLEEEHLDDRGRSKIARRRTETDKPVQMQLTLFGATAHPVLDMVRETDVNQITPLEALQMIARWKGQLEGEG